MDANLIDNGHHGHSGRVDRRARADCSEVIVVPAIRKDRPVICYDGFARDRADGARSHVVITTGYFAAVVLWERTIERF